MEKDEGGGGGEGSGATIKQKNKKNQIRKKWRQIGEREGLIERKRNFFTF